MHLKKKVGRQATTRVPTNNQEIQFILSITDNRENVHWLVVVAVVSSLWCSTCLFGLFAVQLAFNCHNNSENILYMPFSATAVYTIFFLFRVSLFAKHQIVPFALLLQRYSRCCRCCCCCCWYCCTKMYSLFTFFFCCALSAALFVRGAVPIPIRRYTPTEETACKYEINGKQ